MNEFEHIAADDESGLYPKVDNYSRNQEEYVKALESSVAILQNEVESLRSRLNMSKRRSTKAGSSETYESQSEFINCYDNVEVVDKLHAVLSSKFKLIESNLFIFNEKKRLVTASISQADSTLTSIISHLEEQGIIDWACEQRKTSVIPNMNEASGKQITNLILSPIFIRSAAHGVFAALTELRINQLTQTDLAKMSDIILQAALALENIISRNEIRKMNERLSALNQQALLSAKLVSIGQFAASFSKEIDNPLQIVKTNLQLLESGLGNSERRIEIIKAEIERIMEINSRLASLSQSSTSETSNETLNLTALLDETLLFASAQFQKMDIVINRFYESDNYYLKGIKSLLQQAFLNILLFYCETLSDGGTLDISVTQTREDKVSIAFSDNGSGFSNEELRSIIESDIPQISSKFSINFNLVKSIALQHKGNISAFSEIGSGTTFRFIFPLIGMDSK